MTVRENKDQNNLTRTQFQLSICSRVLCLEFLKQFVLTKYQMNSTNLAVLTLRWAYFQFLDNAGTCFCDETYGARHIK